MLELKHAGNAAEIWLSAGPVNALSLGLVAQLQSVLDRIERMDLNLIVFRSRLQTFSAGADLGMIERYLNDPDGVERMVDYVSELHVMFERISALPAVSLAVIDGTALGGGLELALACDLRMATANATMGLPEAQLGMIPGAGGTQRLTRICGPAVSSRLILSAETVSGREAGALGIVNWVVEQDDLESALNLVRTRVSQLSRLSLAWSKRCIAAYYDPAEDGFAVEREAPRETMLSEDTRTRIGSFFAARQARKAVPGKMQLVVGDTNAP